MTIVQRQQSLHAEAGTTLDPDTWDDIRAQGHRMLDDMFDYAASISASMPTAVPPPCTHPMKPG